MKKYVNGELVDMTAEEIEEFEASRSTPTVASSHIAWVRAALADIDKLDAVDAAVAAQGPVKKALWDYCTTLRSDDPDVVAIAGALSIDLADLFRRAARFASERGQ